MRPEARTRLALLAALLLPVGALLAANPTPQHQIEQRLMCHCGCAGLTVRVCTCGVAAEMREEIAGRLGRGETPDQVVAAFVDLHGEKILSAPTMEGFNLLAWVVPFAALFAAALALVLVVRRWAASSRGGPQFDPAAETIDMSALTAAQQEGLSRVEREIREEH